MHLPLRALFSLAATQRRILTVEHGFHLQL
jgi:hypothetical protein